MKTVDKAVQIGDRVRDRISGMVGIATGRTEYLNGCRQFLVSAEKTKDDGDKINGMWIDEQTLQVTAAQVFADPFSGGRAPTVGGPSSVARRDE